MPHHPDRQLWRYGLEEKPRGFLVLRQTRQRVAKLLVNGTALVGVSVPSLVDRFLMVEEWAQKANGMVIVVLVIPAEYIHPEKFGVKVAADFGLISDVYTSETDALKWLLSVADPT